MFHSVERKSFTINIERLFSKASFLYKDWNTILDKKVVYSLLYPRKGITKVSVVSLIYKRIR